MGSLGIERSMYRISFMEHFEVKALAKHTEG